MEKSEPLALYDDDEEESYFACKKQAIDEHLVLGTHRLLELERQDVSTISNYVLVREIPSIQDDFELHEESGTVNSDVKQNAYTLRG